MTTPPTSSMRPVDPVQKTADLHERQQLIGGEGDGTAFFERTHITQGMQDLVSEGIARLAGGSSQAVFHLKQAMGGGKTHSLVGFGLLAKHSTLRSKYCAGVSHADAFEGAANRGLQRPQQSGPLLLGRDRRAAW